MILPKKNEIVNKGDKIDSTEKKVFVEGIENDDEVKKMIALNQI